MVAENDNAEETRRVLLFIFQARKETRELVFASLLENSGMKVA
jgi:hypothetical protein